MDIFIPDVYQKSIYTINYEKLYEDGIRCLLFDLDNIVKAMTVLPLFPQTTVTPL